MGEEDNQRIRNHLGRVLDAQLANVPYEGPYWPGVDIAADGIKPISLPRGAMLRCIRPIATGFHINTLKERISSHGPDMLDEFWYNQSGVNFETYAGMMSSLMRFFQKTNSMDAAIVVTDTSVSVASQAAVTLTCAAGHAYKVRVVAGQNDTRAPTWSLTHTPNGGTAMVFSIPTATVQSQSFPILGGIGYGLANVYGILGPIWLQVGDIMTLTCTNFVAADVMRHDFIFEDYTL